MGQTLGAWLKSEILKHNTSQKQVARATGIATGTISNIIHGHVPSPDIIIAMARHFDADPNTVLEIANIVQLSDVPPELPPDLRDLIRRTYRLPERQREFILSQMESAIRFVESEEEPPANPTE